MKQYKVVRVKLNLVDIGSANFEKVETVMNNMAKDGWEVVCQCPQPGAATTYLLVTFCREEE